MKSKTKKPKQPIRRAPVTPPTQRVESSKREKITEVYDREAKIAVQVDFRDFC